MVICLERGADLHMAQWIPLPLTVSCFSKIQIGFTFLVPAYLGSPGKRVFKCVCVCVNSVTCALFAIDVMCMSCGLIRSEVFEHSCQITAAFNCLQCFDSVGWVSGSAYGL